MFRWAENVNLKEAAKLFNEMVPTVSIIRFD